LRKVEVTKILLEWSFFTIKRAIFSE
jgi:hypothetical protein